MTIPNGCSNPSATARSSPRRTPDRELTVFFLGEYCWVTCLWLLVYGGANWIASQHGYRIRTHTDQELAIPLVAPAVVIYLSLFPMLWLAPIALQTRGELRALARAIAWMIVVAGIGFLALPSELAHCVPSVDGPIGIVFRFADAINLRYNMLPSLHVAMAMGCAVFYSAHGGTWAKLIWWTWSAAIAVSTLLTHQHHVVDLVTGAALGVGISAALGRRSYVNLSPAS